MKSRFTFSKALVYAALFLCALYWIAPMYVMLIASFKSVDEIRASSIFAWPETFTLYAWGKAWSGVCSGRVCEGVQPYFFTTFAIAIPAVCLAVWIGALNGYVMAQWRSRGSDILFSLILIGSFVPLQLFLIPIAVTLRNLDIFGTTPGLILVHTIYGIPLTTMLFRNFYVALPQELVQAAIIDGAGFFKIFRSIILPLSPSIIIVSVILMFTGVYNDFLFALTFGGETAQPIMVAVQNVVASVYGEKEYNVNIAAVLFSAAPTLLIYIVAGKYFMHGLTQGALKG